MPVLKHRETGRLKVGLLRRPTDIKNVNAMNTISEGKRILFLWLAPFTGALFVALFLTIRGFILDQDEPVILAFLGLFVERLFVSYLCALPLLGLSYRLGLRCVFAFMLLASFASIPLEYYTSVPIHGWHPTDEELLHGTYWDAMIPSVILASATGWMFSRGVITAERKGSG